MEKSIILDLDDTIFPTKSIDKKTLEPFLNFLIPRLKTHYSDEIIESIVNDLWEKPWDITIKKYNIDNADFLDAINVFDEVELNLNISPYPDYEFIKRLPYKKFLVTTSSTSIQQKKIKALNIENDFLKIIINDPFKEKKTKLVIFEELVRDFNLIPENTYVIGDNSDSEIKAGNNLNMITIQILRNNVKKGNNADFYITSFYELEKILS